MIKVNVRKIGNSLGIILPKETTRHMRVKEGDSIYLTESSSGYHMGVRDAEFERQMKIAEEGIKKFRNALRELSKK